MPTIETVDTIKCGRCKSRTKIGITHYCEQHAKYLESFTDRSGVWVNKCDECLAASQ